MFASSSRILMSKGSFCLLWEYIHELLGLCDRSYNLHNFAAPRHLACYTIRNGILPPYPFKPDSKYGVGRKRQFLDCEEHMLVAGAIAEYCNPLRQS